MDNKCHPWPPWCLGLQRSVRPHPRCQHSPSNDRLQSVTCLLEVLSLPPADEKSKNIHNSFWLFCVVLLLSLLHPSWQSRHGAVSLSPSDGPGSAVALGNKRRQSQLLLWFTQSLPRHHHHFIRTLTVHNQASGDQHDRQRQASR